ncbi:MAG: carbohydrate binding family 9 domain-containing protein [Fluviicola sp.]|nr:carbohydrate binding family 9 domain-containing protein [Fluviicola sp.]
MQTRFLLGAILFMLLTFQLHGQKTYTIEKSVNAIKLDGLLNETQWQNADIATDFTTQSPIYGEKSRFTSIVKMYYDDDAIYIGAELHDPSPDSVSYTLSQRDDSGNADWFGITIDPYANNVTGFGFAVTAAGVEMDALVFVSDLDGSWNAVWKSVAKKRDFGWSFEMKIPFSALRFPNTKVQDWNINFVRQVRRMREESNWNPVDPNVFGGLPQAGKLVGVENIKSPVRLSFTPYATSYAENSYDNVLARQTWKTRLTGGLDLKYGLNDAFTLDMTVIPDFGQTRSDNEILNLGPFEVRYNENRQFFIEGTDLFQIGGIFYSRRIGSNPFDKYAVYSDLDASIGEEVVSNPQTAQMINGTKVSGRTKGGLGVGVFNAVEGRSFAVIEDSSGRQREFRTNPLTNYNVFVLSQNLKNNSTMSLVNTNVTREGSARDANVTLGQVRLFTKDGNYRLNSTITLSSLFENKETVFGHKVGTSIDKVAGKWQYGMSYREESDTYDPNDLGFLYNNNSRTYSARISWNGYTPTKRFFRQSFGLNWRYSELYKPQLYNSTRLSFFAGGLHKKQLYMRLSGGVNPFGSVDHFESRTFGKIVRFKPNANFNYFFTSDYSKRFALDGSIGYSQFFNTVQNNISMYLSPRLRISDQMNMVLGARVNLTKNGYGYVSGQDPGFSDEIILGIRDLVNVENTITSEFIFTKRMGIDLVLRHYWAQVEYSRFVALEDDGVMRTIDYNAESSEGESVHNTNYNAFTIDLNYRWVFIPGSELRIVYKNNIFSSKSMLESSYFETFNTLFQQPQINSISLKFLIYVDVLYFKRKNRKRGELEV